MSFQNPEYQPAAPTDYGAAEECVPTGAITPGSTREYTQSQRRDPHSTQTSQYNPFKCAASPVGNLHRPDFPGLHPPVFSRFRFNKARGVGAYVDFLRVKCGAGPELQHDGASIDLRIGIRRRIELGGR
jgi:hypothetical protein